MIQTFLIISGIVLWSLIILVFLWILYDDIKYRLKQRKQYKKAMEILNSQEWHDNTVI